jgi:hypothetical protein
MKYLQLFPLNMSNPLFYKNNKDTYRLTSNACVTALGGSFLNTIPKVFLLSSKYSLSFIPFTSKGNTRDIALSSTFYYTIPQYKRAYLTIFNVYFLISKGKLLLFEEFK